MSDLPTIAFEDEAVWEQWLEVNHLTTQGLWLKLAKKESGIKSISYAEALTIALCFGWIDGQKAKFNEQYWAQKFTPRRKKSVWSRVNREKAEALIASGKMREAGLREVERAKENGLWDTAYESQSRIMVPEDFRMLLTQNPIALAFFEQLDSVNRYAVLYRITTAKNAQTREKQINKLIEMLNAGKKIYN